MRLHIKLCIISTLIFVACTINTAKYPLCTDPSVPIIGDMVLKIDSSDPDGAPGQWIVIRSDDGNGNLGDVTITGDLSTQKGRTAG